jgi:hypothetical protein
MSDAVPPPHPQRKPVRTAADRRYALYVTLAIAVAVGAMALAINRTNTDNDEPPIVSSRPDIVEHLRPLNGDEHLRQAEFGIDLAPGYEGTLVVNGVEIPKRQLREVPEQNQVFFTPGEGTVIEELPAGETCVTAIVWRSSQGRGIEDRRVSWCFDVT